MTTKEFETKGYVYIKNFLDKENCKELVVELNKAIDNNITIQDAQCPTSQAIHSNKVSTFDKLLEDLTPHFEKASGLKLYPTYAYARLYKPGEELKIHRDRPACEISATITLGFEGDKWPIYMSHKQDKSQSTKIEMDVGDATLYRGIDVYHWREKYTQGKWQAQIFLHYVNQNGPHADHKYDKRGYLSHHNPTSGLSDYYARRNALSDGFCDKLVEEYSKDTVEKLPPIIGQGVGVIDTNIRNVKRLMLPMGQSVGATLTATGLEINHNFYKYNITHANQTEFLMYEPEGCYVAHTDTFHDHSDETRKITMLVFLNDDFEGGKFFIQTGYDKVYPPQEKGTILGFPSYMLHGVEPVTKGIRYSCVTWLAGPYFK